MSDTRAVSDIVHEPVIAESGAEIASTAPREGIGLCLSGGGYRAMLFHVGTLWRLNECGLLPQLSRISSVSGGSITAATLGLNWSKLAITPANPIATKTNLDAALVQPIRALAGETIDLWAVGIGMVLPGRSISDEIERYYAKYLFEEATLQDLPDDATPGAGPRFVINATNVKSGSLWRFSRPFMGDWQVGLIRSPTVPLAKTVAASSAFPPFLSPVRLPLDPGSFDPAIQATLTDTPFRDEAVLTDGGVYDNLGLEPVWKEYTTVLVSDGGRKVAPDKAPASDWARHSRRLIDLLQYQISSLRRRNLIQSFQDKTRKGAYWGIQTDIANYKVPTPLSCPIERTQILAETETRLAALPGVLQEQLINWGYAACDAALRAHVLPELQPPAAFPYPASPL